MKTPQILLILVLVCMCTLANAQLTLLGHEPSSNGQNVARDANIELTFNTNIKAETLNSSGIIISGSLSGLISGEFAGGNTSIITFNPAKDFFSGEEIRVTITQNVANEAGLNLNNPESFSFLAASRYESEKILDENTVSTSLSTPVGAQAVDLNGDGNMDIVVAASNDNSVVWYENDGNQNFTEHLLDGGGLFRPISVHPSDIDGDGDMDLSVGFLLSSTISWYENDGEENFTLHEIASSVSTPLSVFSIDVDKDGDMDVLSASLIDNTISWYENDGNQTFTQHDITNSAASARSVYASDIDSDGDVDVLSASADDNKIAWYENDGNQSFTSHTIHDNASEASSVISIDVDSDGDVDVLSTSLNDNAVRWYENDGNQVFTIHEISNQAMGAFRVGVADLDGDEDIDVLSTSINDNKIVWYENNGEETFEAHEISDMAMSANSAFPADIDGDGTIDVVTSSGNDNKVTWYKSIDVTAPTVIVSTTILAPANSIPVSITFSEEVTSFTVEDVTVVNGTASDFTDQGGGVFTLAVTGDQDGAVEISVPATVCFDLSGNNNLASNTLEATYDGTAPTTVITTTSGDLTEVDDIPITVDFSEPVTGFDISDITIVNGTPSNFADNGDNSYDVTVTASAEGLVSVEIAEAVASDAAGNVNVASNKLEVTYDIPNETPVVVSNIQNQSLTITGASAEELTLTLSDFFSDPDGDVLSFTAESENAGIVTVEVSVSNELVIKAVSEGTTKITVTANDGNGGMISQEFNVTVELTLSTFDDEILKVYPNPTADLLTLPSQMSSGDKVFIYTLNGSLVSGVKMDTSHTISLKNLPNGTYLVRAKDANGKIFEWRVVKVKTR